MATLLQSLFIYNTMLHCIQNRALVYYNTSLLDENLFRNNGNFINIPVKTDIKPQYDLMHCINQSSTTRIARIHSCCQSRCGSSSTNPPGVSLSPPTSRCQQRLQRWERSSPAPCASGGRSGREGGRSEGSSGDPPRHSVPSYSPEQHKGGTRVRHTSTGRLHELEQMDRGQLVGFLLCIDLISKH